MRQAAARHARHAIAQWLSRQQRSDRRSSRRRWSRWQDRRVERRRGGLGRRVARVARVHLQHPARDRSRSPRSRSRLEVNHQLAAAALSERHAPCRRHDGVMIDILSRRSRRVHVRHLARDHPRSLRSRARLEMRDQLAAAALPTAPYAPPSHDRVMIDIRSRRPRRVLVRVRHLARDHPRSLRSRARLEMRDQSAAAALSERHTPRQSHDSVMIDLVSRRSYGVNVRHLARDHPRSPRSRARLEMRDQ